MVSLAIIYDDMAQYISLLGESLRGAEKCIDEVLIVCPEGQKPPEMHWRGQEVPVYPATGTRPALYNKALEKAKGEWVMFCKADITFDASFFDEFNGNFHGETSIYCFEQESVTRTGENVLGWNYQIDRPYYIASCFSDCRMENFYYGVGLSEGCWLAPKECLHFSEKFRYSVFEQAAVLASGCGVKKLDGCRVFYRNVDYMQKIESMEDDLNTFIQEYPAQAETLRHASVLWANELACNTQRQLEQCRMELNNKKGHVEQLLAQKLQADEAHEQLHQSLNEAQRALEDERHRAAEAQRALADEQRKVNEQEEKLRRQQTHAEELVQLAEQRFDVYVEELRQKDGMICQARDCSQQILNSTSLKLMHFWSRIKNQLLLGSMTEKVHFLRWLLRRPDEVADRRFQPLNTVFQLLQGAAAVPVTPNCKLEQMLAERKRTASAGMLKNAGFLDSAFLQYVQNDRARFNAIAQQGGQTPGSQEIVRLLRTQAATGIVVSPCIEDSKGIEAARQKLSALAKEGWLCLQAIGGLPSSLEKKEENYYYVQQEDLLRALQLEPATLLLSWAGNMPFADAVPVKQVWYHLASFPNRAALYDAVYEQLHDLLLQRADFVTYDAPKLESELHARTDAQCLADAPLRRLTKYLLDGGSVPLPERYDKYDVIILSVIDYDFRFQRPQHFAVRFAENGHRVFYVNANFHRGSSVKKLRDNLYVVDIEHPRVPAIYGTSWDTHTEELYKALDGVLWQYAIRDAVTIVDYPNWVSAAEYLRERYGFKFVVDYMDDYTGFLEPAEKGVGENCTKLLKSCDAVIPSSQFLADIAQKYHPVKGIVRNGTEYTFFHTAFCESTGNERKIIGYYGAVAHWFDAEKVCYLAKNLPDCEVVIVGAVTEWREQLEACKNIRLLGEKAYEELPEYLRSFDVCLIPFDTSTDLIKATNPVKFYEYLSAGKKVVATEIPELEPYRDRYVYMANDDETFLQYVQRCLDGTDTLASPAECAAFAQENDWQHRFEQFAELMQDAVPMVSIIMLTYNNLKLNRLCVRSILEKTAYPRYELIIVDNDSRDGTAEWLHELQKKKLPNVRIILNGENRGFAGGNNVGIRAAKGEYIVLLNNDTVPTRGWLTALAKHMENDPKMGMCGPVTNSIGNEAKIAVEYHELSELEQFAYRYTWNHTGEELLSVKALAMFCTMIRREVIERCGMLDERYKVGMFEDDDYSEAVRAGGWRLAIVDDAFVHHQDGATFKKLDKEKYNTVFKENLERFEKKWNIKWEMHAFRPGVTAQQNSDCLLEV